MSKRISSNKSTNGTVETDAIGRINDVRDLGGSTSRNAFTTNLQLVEKVAP